MPLWQAPSPACASSASVISAMATCITTSRSLKRRTTPISSHKRRPSIASYTTWSHELGGSISAEHGLGQLKREEILRYKSAVEMDMMRAIKQALDPHRLMNPGKIL